MFGRNEVISPLAPLQQVPNSLNPFSASVSHA